MGSCGDGARFADIVTATSSTHHHMLLFTKWADDARRDATILPPYDVAVTMMNSLKQPNDSK